MMANNDQNAKKERMKIRQLKVFYFIFLQINVIFFRTMYTHTLFIVNNKDEFCLSFC